MLLLILFIIKLHRNKRLIGVHKYASKLITYYQITYHFLVKLDHLGSLESV